MSEGSPSLKLALALLLCAFRASAAEIHAVWDHKGTGLYPGDWPRTIRLLQASRVTDLFVNVGGVDFAHYASAYLPKTRARSLYGDQLAACVGAARGTGVRVHAWFICFNATRAGTPELETFRKRGWRLRDAKKGGLTTYLDPSNPEVRAYVLRAVGELARYPVSGVHLDFVRWGDAAAKPSNATSVIAKFVAEARRRVKRPKWLTAAVYGKHPNCVASVGQDWPRWIDMDLVDYVVPMNYTSSTAKFCELLSLQRSPRFRAKRTIVGIGVTANESRLDARQVVRQIGLARQCGFAGQALFDLDETLEKAILPVLRNGVWQARGQAP